MKRFTLSHHMTRVFILALTIVGLLPLVASALPLDNSAAYQVANTTYTRGGGDIVQLYVNGKTEWVYSVEIKAQLIDPKGNFVNNGQWFTGFCVDPVQDAQLGGRLPVNLVAPSQDTGSWLAPQVKGGLSEVAWLVENRKSYQPSNAQWTNYESAALQVAIWEVLVDYNAAESYNLVSGGFQLPSADANVVNLANFYLDSLKNFTWNSGLDSKYKITASATNQDFILNIADPATPAVTGTPEPGTLILLGAGLLGLFGFTRKHSR